MTRCLPSSLESGCCFRLSLGLRSQEEPERCRLLSSLILPESRRRICNTNSEGNARLLLAYRGYLASRTSPEESLSLALCPVLVTAILPILQIEQKTKSFAW